MIDAQVGPKANIGDPKDPFGATLGGIIDQLQDRNGKAAFKQIYAGFFSEHAGRDGRQAIAEAAQTPIDVAVAELHGIGINTQAIAKQIKKPVLWLTVTDADQAAVGKAFRDVQFGQTVGSGHFPQLEVPVQTNAMLERFVENL